MYRRSTACFVTTESRSYEGLPFALDLVLSAFRILSRMRMTRFWWYESSRAFLTSSNESPFSGGLFCDILGVASSAELRDCDSKSSKDWRLAGAAISRGIDNTP